MVLESELALVFLEEARGHLAVVGDETRTLEARAQAAEALRQAAGLVGLKEVQAAVDDVMAALRARRGVDMGFLRGLIDRLAVDAPPPPPAAPPFDTAETELLQSVFREEVNEQLDGLTAALIVLEREGASRPLLDELLRKTHTIKGSAATVGLAAVAEAAHQLEDVFADLRAGRIPLGDRACDTLLAAGDSLRAIVEQAQQQAPLGGHLERLGEQLQALRALRTSTASTLALDQTVVARRRRTATTMPIVVRPEARPDGETEAAVDERRAGERRREDAQVLRVDTARVDQLMDGAGELVFDRTRIERRGQELRAVARDLNKARAGLRGFLGALRGGAERDGTAALVGRLAELEQELAAATAHLSRAAAALLEDAESLRRTTTMLQEGIARVRLTSVRWLFARLARPLRDLERSEGKRVELVTTGEETELDKAVVEKITDPLIQLIRNAVAHGIEPATLRATRGKPPVGRIALSARHQGDSVFLEVADDGAGIDADRVRDALVAAGRMSPIEAQAAGDERIIAAIFEPGVSTRRAADAVAGRGVGLDVVREAIVKLGGEVAVASTAGEGARFTIRLPLTTAITQAFLFKVAGQVYAIPNVHVVDTTSADALDGTVPVLALHRVLGVDSAAQGRGPAVVLEYGGRRLAATCDKVIGPREIVIKSLGPLLAPLGLYAGATISGAGKVQLILDPAALTAIAHPAATASAGDSSTMVAAPEPPPRSRILVADDSRSARDAVARMLATEGYIVDQAADGEEAWQMLHEVPYQVLVTDLEMPRLAGAQLIEQVRADPALASVRVLVLSSRTAQRERAAAAGADAFLGKPVTRQTISDEVRRLLGRASI